MAEMKIDFRISICFKLITHLKRKCCYSCVSSVTNSRTINNARKETMIASCFVA